MPAQIAVLADIHLSDAPGSPQEAALVYALNCLREDAPDVVLVLGDATRRISPSSSDNEGWRHENHFPITDVYGSLISLSSFFWGWKTAALRRAPIFLEIRSARFEDAVDSLRYIRRHVREA